jgi:hypothetical protein
MESTSIVIKLETADHSPEPALFEARARQKYVVF